MRSPVALPSPLALALALAVAAPAAAPPAAAVEVAEGVQVQAQLRTRFARNNGRDGDNGDDAAEYFEQRARLGVDVDAVAWMRAMIQLQDVRVWGEEASTLTDFSADGLDVHQAFVDLRVPDWRLTVRVGRQEIAIDEERLVGAVGWTPQGRSLDAVRALWTCRTGALKAEAFYAQLLDEESIAPGPATNANTDSISLAAGGVRWDRALEGTDRVDLSVYGFVDLAEEADRTRYTVGARHAGALGILRYRVEGWYQGGSVGGDAISAFLLGANAGVALPKARGLTLLAWVDLVSGDSDPAKAGRRTFDAALGTNHKFYGLADYFIDLPAHTGGRGLLDLAVKASVAPAEGWRVYVDGHHFHAPWPQGGSSTFGTEIDLGVGWKPVKPITLTVDLFTMLPGDALEARLGGKDADVGFYATVQGDI